MIPDLNQQLIEGLRRLLGRCEQVRDERQLRWLFVNKRISMWSDGLPEADNVSARINGLIDYFSKRANKNGEWALVLFLEVLSDDVPQGDMRRIQLVNLSQRLQELYTQQSRHAPQTENPPRPVHGPLAELIADKNESQMRNLVEQLARPGGVIPFIGAGLSIPHGFLGWTEFLRREAERSDIVEEVERFLTQGQYEEAAERLRKKQAFRAFEDAIREEYGEHKLRNRTLGGVVTLIPKLANGPVLTTNFDRVLELAFVQAGRPFDHVLWGVTDLAQQVMQERRPFLIKIHGDAEDPANLILTKPDYLKNYGGLNEDNIDGERPLPQMLELVFRAAPLLFIGCSLNRDRTVTFLGKVAREHQGLAHYAIVEAPNDVKDFHARAKLFSKHGIRPIWYPFGEHALIGSYLEYILEQAGKT